MKWEDYKEIAEALNTMYPGTSPVMMPRSELIEKVIALPGFTGGKIESDDFYLSAIAKKWILVRDGGRTRHRGRRPRFPSGTSTIDDSPFI